MTWFSNSTFPKFVMVSTPSLEMGNEFAGELGGGPGVAGQGGKGGVGKTSHLGLDTTKI